MRPETEREIRLILYPYLMHITLQMEISAHAHMQKAINDCNPYEKAIYKGISQIFAEAHADLTRFHSGKLGELNKLVERHEEQDKKHMKYLVWVGAAAVLIGTLHITGNYLGLW